jgi:hypothetical protein
MIKYPHLEYLRQVVREVKGRTNYAGRDENNEPIFEERTQPTLSFLGTVKLHGTNASVVQQPDGTLTCQSRNQDFGVPGEEGHFGFVKFITERQDIVNQMFASIRNSIKYAADKPIALYGEWVGRGINAGHAVHQLTEKRWVLFVARIKSNGEDKEYDEEEIHLSWLVPNFPFNKPSETRIHNIYQYPTYQIDINFNDVNASQDKLTELTNAIEECCPFGKANGVEGMGEGIVWQCISPPWNLSSRFWFKTKGPKSMETVPRKDRKVEIDTELAKTIQEFIDTTVTTNRLEHGVQYLRENGHEITERSTGVFLKWFVGDLLREEVDRLALSKSETGKLRKEISVVARRWFFSYIKDNNL